MAPINTDFYDRIVGLVDQTHRLSRIDRMWLGGSPGPDGGEGSRPGGFIGQLIQRAVAYDTTEAATLAGSGTLVDNLNHIRYNVNLLSGILVSGFLGLIDTPDTYSGQGGKVVIVNDEETRLEFTDTIAGGGNTVIEGVTRWATSSGINTLELPDRAEIIYMLSNNGSIVDYLQYELSDDGFYITLSGTTIGDTIFNAHYLVRTY